MKKISFSLFLAAMMQAAFAQYNQNNNQNQQTGTQQDQNNPSNQNQTNPNMSNPNQTNPNMQSQNMDMDHDWDMYGGTRVETSRVPQTTSKAFSTKYPNRNDVTWYSYSKGYIATYPGTNKMREGVLYDKNGKMMGTVTRERTSTLSSSVTTNMKKKYPNYSEEYVYVVTTPTGKKMYVTKNNGSWSEFNDTGTYMENR